MLVAATAVLAAAVGFALARWLYRARGVVGDVVGEIDAWAVHAAAERTLKALEPRMASVTERATAAKALQRLTVIGSSRPFVPQTPWEQGFSTAAISRDFRRAWVVADRAQLDQRVARIVAHVVHQAVYGSPGSLETDRGWFLAALEPFTEAST